MFSIKNILKCLAKKETPKKFKVVVLDNELKEDGLVVQKFSSLLTADIISVVVTQENADKIMESLYGDLVVTNIQGDKYDLYGDFVEFIGE